MDGEACTARCGYCGRCTDGPRGEVFACQGCGGDVWVSAREPYPGPRVWCDPCIERRLEKKTPACEDAGVVGRSDRERPHPTKLVNANATGRM